MSDLNKIIDVLSKLTVVEAADLSKKLEEKWGVSAAVPVAAAVAPLAVRLLYQGRARPEGRLLLLPEYQLPPKASELLQTHHD